jgi:hypothetical protein
LEVSIVIAGALFQLGLVSAFEGLEGQPALTATELAAACLATTAAEIVVVVELGTVVVVDDEVVVVLLLLVGAVLDEVLNPPARAMIPTIIAMTNPMTVPRRILALRFRSRSNSARRAARAAF